ncbi:MAG: hypothetical protein RIG62_22370 [Cyclobacteriaceae bacterium]
MGWKTSTIIINKPALSDHQTLLADLGFTKLKQSEAELFEVAMYPKNGEVYIGSYQDKLIICVEELPMQIIETENSAIEEKLIQQFPDAEICAIVLHSVVNLWGYAIIKNGQKIRARAGSSDGGTFLDTGEPLEEEKALLSKARFDENGDRVYWLDDFPDEPFQEDQVGENFVFSVCKRYFHQELDTADELLFETRLTGYSYGRVVQKSRSNPTQGPSKPWWKFW